MRLTDLTVKRLKLPPGSGSKQKTYFDDTMKGFGVRVSVGGAKSYVVMYGKYRRLKTIARCSDIKLAKARSAAQKLLGSVADTKNDPALAGEKLSFAAARERFLEDARLRTKASTHKECSRLLHKHFPFTQALAKVTRQDIMDVIAGLQETPSAARHAYLAIRTMMNWVVARGLLTVSPVPPMKFTTAFRSRVLSDGELKAVWKRAEEFDHPYGPIVQLLILTGQRRGEIAGLRRSWVHKDSITFPQGFTKNKREHRIPLGAMAKSIVNAALEGEGFVFPVKAKAKGDDEEKEVSFSGWSKAKRQFDKPLKIKPYTLHDLRRTFASKLAALGTPIHVTEKLMNHVSGSLSGVAGIYNRYTYAQEMRTAMDRYERSLTELFASDPE